MSFLSPIRVSFGASRAIAFDLETHCLDFNFHGEISKSVNMALTLSFRASGQPFWHSSVHETRWRSTSKLVEPIPPYNFGRAR